MKLDSEDLTGLAALLLRRFPTDEARSEVLRAAGVEDPGDWSMALQHAQAAGRLAALLRLAAQAHPDDENLQGIAATLDRPQVPKVAFAVAGVALVVLIGGAIAWYGSADEKINRIADERATDRPAGVVVAVPDRLASPVLAPPTALSPDLEPETEAAPDAEAPEAVDEPDPSVEDAAPPIEEAQAPVEKLASSDEPAEQPSAGPKGQYGRCGGPDGDLVGYWYAGFPFEAAQGVDYTVKNGANVREDYPRKGNGWSVKTPVVCSLRSGDVVHLSEAPILVDGGKYWVPLHAGDLKE